MPQPLPHLADIYRTPVGLPRKGFLRMDMNENVDGLPDHVVDTILARLTPEVLAGYPETGRFADALSAMLKIEPANLLVTAGSDGAISCLFDAMIRPGDLVVITDPSFAMYPIYCAARQARCRQIPFRPDLSFPLDAYLGALNEGPRVAVVVSPNNPTGATLSHEEVHAISNSCREKDILLLLDEAYTSPLETGHAALTAGQPHLVVTRTFSKLGGIAGLRLGYAAGPPNIIQAMRSLKPSFDVTAAAIEAGLVLMENPAILRDMEQRIAAGRDHLLAGLRSLGLSYVSGDAPFVLIHCGQRRDEVAVRLEAKSILVKTGFSTAGIEDTIRVSLGGPQTMDLFLHNLRHIWSTPDAHALGTPTSEEV